MHKYSECDKCKKRRVCKLIDNYLYTCNSLEDTNTNDYVSKLHCKHEEKE